MGARIAAVIFARVAFPVELFGLLGMLLGCAGRTPVAVAPPPPEPAPPEAPPEPPKVEPAPLPFHMPCAADDVVGCTNACNDKFVEDCVTLGAMYMAGTVVTIDRERAATLFHEACDRDSARGCMRLAEAYHAGITPTGAPPREPHAEEVLLYRRACEGGANLGCVQAGRAFAEGHGVPRDPKEAARLFGPVCDRGNADACLELGKLVQRGEGGTPSPERALALYRKACSLGLAEGCLHVSPKGEERSPRE